MDVVGLRVLDFTSVVVGLSKSRGREECESGGDDKGLGHLRHSQFSNLKNTQPVARPPSIGETRTHSLPLTVRMSEAKTAVPLERFQTIAPFGDERTFNGVPVGS